MSRVTRPSPATSNTTRSAWLPKPFFVSLRNACSATGWSHDTVSMGSGWEGSSIASRPSIVFADEPTGNLDSRSGAEVLALLRRSVDEFGQTIVMVTHDPVAAAFTDRVVFLADGKVVDEIRNPDRETVLDRMTRMDARQIDRVAHQDDDLAGAQV